ncbi:MAG: amidohydrolase family protein [Victivallales bacterium]|nr:amidohydrolase family protein [Victivallales bacterium]
MFLDMHVHAYLFPGPPQDGHTQFANPKDILELYDAHGIERGVLMPLIGPEVYLPQSNEEILETCRLYPGRFIPFCNLDPRGIGNSPKTDFSPWLSWYRDHGFKGIGEFMPNLPFTHPLVLNFFRQVEEFGFPLTFDISSIIGGRYGLYDDAGLPQLETCLKAFPKLNIIGHGPAFWNEIGPIEPGDERDNYIRRPVRSEGVLYRLFRDNPNLWADLSAGSAFFALTRDKENAVKFINEFQDRLMYATDICTAGKMYSMDSFLIELKDEHAISEATFRKIARENAVRLLNL